MGFEGGFRKAIFGRKGVDETPRQSAGVAAQLHPAMAAELLRLDLYGQGLGRVALRYAFAGEPATFLSELEAIVTRIPHYQSPYHKDNAAVNDAQGKVDVALAKGEITDGPAIARFIAVRRLVRPMVSMPSYGPPPFPESQLPARELFAAIMAGDSRLNSHSYHIQPPPPLVPTIGPREVLRLLGYTGADLVDYFQLACANPTNDRQVSHPEFAELVSQFPDGFAAAIGRPSSDTLLGHMIRVAERLGALAHPPVLLAFAGLVGKGRSKTIREAAISTLARLDSARLLNLLQSELASAEIETRFDLVQAAGRNGSPEILALLGERGKVEKAAKVKAAIEAVLQSSVAEEASGAEAGGEPGYGAIDGSFVAIPPVSALDRSEPPVASDEECVEFMRIVEVINAERAQNLAKQVPGKEDRSRYYQPLTRAEIEATFELLTDGKPLPGGQTYVLASALRRNADGRAWYNAVLDRRSIPVALSSLILNQSGEIAMLVGAQPYIDPNSQFAVDKLREWLQSGKLGLRELIALEHEVRTARFASRGEPCPPLDPLGHLRAILHQRTYIYDRRDLLAALKELPNAAVWPWLAENFQFFDEALGLKPAEKPISLDQALNVLALLPKAPQRYLPRLLEIAVAEKRPLRRQAMALLREAKDLAQRIEALLDDARQQVRSNAATWLADIRSQASEAALRKRLKKEKSDPVRAALVEALQRLGADLSDVIGPPSLIAEADKAAAKGAPELPGWLTVSGLPAVHFRDGATVPERVLRHWLALAIRLKDPGATGQFGIYLDQLTAQGARSLSNWVLESWIAYDTHSSSLEDATAYAQANYQQNFNWMYHSTKTPELRDQVIAQMIREKTGDLLNSGSDTKGMLALACRADPVWAANRVRWFLKKHGRRSNQAMALLEVLAGIGEPAALQVVIAASARLKQKSTQARAAEIAERYAEDRGWSFDELADRTVPSAGFDDDGVLELPCGEDAKLYTARLDAMLAIHLFNPDGKAVKSLPAGDDEATRESKKAFTAAKKELSQVIDLQGTRLFEAMCVERSWPVADWRMAFHEHPVMRRLIERLVWEGLDPEDRSLGQFRPTQEGDFTDAGDNPVAIDHFAKVRLAHGALVDAATCAAWAAHLKDYEIKPFIAQFDTVRAPLSDEQGEAEALFDRQGWKADSLTFRGVAEKRGYERVMRDGGGCHEYEKKFLSHGITATIFHTGSYAIDENNPVALKELRFAKPGQRGGFRLKDVPPVMLAECWADYHAVAAKGAFDPEWETISPW
jgi:Domain of unknown function (DUF4132)/HEAT repeats